MNEKKVFDNEEFERNIKKKQDEFIEKTKNKKYPFRLSDEEFYNLIDNCANALIKNKETLKEICFNHTRSMDIKFRFRPDEIVTMTIDSNHNVLTKKDEYPILYY